MARHGHTYLDPDLFLADSNPLAVFFSSTCKHISKLIFMLHPTQVHTSAKSYPYVVLFYPFPFPPWTDPSYLGFSNEQNSRCVKQHASQAPFPKDLGDCRSFNSVSWTQGPIQNSASGLGTKDKEQLTSQSQCQRRAWQNDGPPKKDTKMQGPRRTRPRSRDPIALASLGPCGEGEGCEAILLGSLGPKDCPPSCW